MSAHQKTLFLHLGRHKTGTTNLQFFLHEQAAALADKGILYPRTGRDFTPGSRYSDKVAHHQMALMFANPRNAGPVHISRLRNQLLEETASYEAVVISSEAFQNVQNFYDLKRLFDGFRIVTVGYLREYLAYTASAYAQEVQTSGMFSSFEIFERGFGLNVEAFVTRWETVADEAIWRLYDRSRLIDGDIISDFLDVIGLQMPIPDAESDKNQSISGNLLGFKLLVNALSLHDPGQSHALGGLAKAHPRFTGTIQLSEDAQTTLRARNRCNLFLEAQFGDVPLKDFSKGNRVLDPETFAQDLPVILAGLKDCPAVTDHPMFQPVLESYLCRSM